jgi:hypothetical protein
MVLTSISNISKVFDNLDMMRMGRTTHHHAASTAAVGTDWGSWLKSWIAAGHHTNCCAVVESVDAPGIHMMWMDRRIHHHAATTPHMMAQISWGVT